jgi:hypothetical protein
LESPAYRFRRHSLKLHHASRASRKAALRDIEVSQSLLEIDVKPGQSGVAAQLSGFRDEMRAYPLSLKRWMNGWV